MSKIVCLNRGVNVLFNDALNTFYIRLYGIGDMVKDHSEREKEETRCPHMGYYFRLTARVLLYALSHRQDSTYHGLCYTSRGALAGTRNSSMGPFHERSIRRPIAPWANALTTELHLAPLDREIFNVCMYICIWMCVYVSTCVCVRARGHIHSHTHTHIIYTKSWNRGSRI